MKFKDLNPIINEIENKKSIFDCKLRVTYYDRPIADEESLKSYFENLIRCEKNWEYAEGYCDSENSTSAIKKLLKDSTKGKFDIVLVKDIYKLPLKVKQNQIIGLSPLGTTVINIVSPLRLKSIRPPIKLNYPWIFIAVEPKKIEQEQRQKLQKLIKVK